MHAIIQRAHMSKTRTLGMMRVEGMNYPPIYTLERPWLDNRRLESCIPEGTYRCTPFNGQRFKNVWQVVDVPNRTAILFHAGNVVREIQGCILVGFGLGYLRDEAAVLRSGDAIDFMRKHFPPTFNLTVRNS